MKVVIGIPHALLREGLRDMLKRWSDVEVAAVSPSAAEAARAAGRAVPDVLIISRGARPAEDARAVLAAREAAPLCKVVLVEDVGRSPHADVLEVDWRVLPSVGPSGLVKGLCSLCATGVRGQAADAPGAATTSKPRLLLSGREHEVVRAVCEGLSNKDIAGRFGISEKTVKNHLSNVYRRTKLSGRTQLVLWAMRRGLGTGSSSTDR